MAETPHKVTFRGELRNELAERFAKQAEQRGVTPSALAADLLEKIIADDLFGAVLDD